MVGDYEVISTVGWDGVFIALRRDKGKQVRGK
jgi:hypothetical protein